VGYTTGMNNIERKVVSAYVPYETTLREVGRIVGIDHHRVKRILESNSIEVIRGRRKPLTEGHKRKISESCKGRTSWTKGKRMSKMSLYKNMIAHIRFDIKLDWVIQFHYIEKIKVLNKCITCRGGRFDCDTDWYISYINKFYSDMQFNMVYATWISREKEPYLRPSIDHILPRSKGGTNDISNLQFLSWFENRCKNDMTQLEWRNLKSNISDYLI